MALRSKTDREMGSLAGLPERFESELESRERESRESRERESRERESRESRERESRERKSRESRERESRERKSRESRERESRERKSPIGSPVVIVGLLVYPDHSGVFRVFSGVFELSRTFPDISAFSGFFTNVRRHSGIRLRSAPSSI